MRYLRQFLKTHRTRIIQIATSVVFLYTAYAYLHTIRNLSVNFPLGDDYDAILDFLNQWAESDSKISLLFSQHNEHRPVFLRLISLAYFQIFHKINFIQLILIGNAFVFFSLGILYISISDRRKSILIAPVFFLIFSFSNWETQTWAMAALSNFPVIFFGFLSLYLLSKKGSVSFAFGIVSAIVASFSQGNGIFLFLSAIPLVFGNKPKLLIWSIVAMFVATFYFLIFPYSRPSHSRFEFFTFDILFFQSRISYGLTLLSSVFNSKFVILLGFVPIIALIYLYKNYGRFSRTHLAMISFLLLSLASLVIARGGFEVEQAYSSRYQINTLLIYSLIYLCLFPYIRIKKHFGFILLFAGIFYYNSNLLNLNQIHIQKQKILLDIACKTQCKTYYTYPEANRAKTILIESSAKGTFVR
ncbi:hypothetical protein [Leptospira yasudae]|uniref:Glycosyltransferase RgtA/B/C/D-like domain-containing protein n=1 Tax=Leptospira yasudae TaxID=2202201 RepID=A0A6N4QQ78_9LEPT|nr:hypothetical protein [Leptospira yasudae]TGL74455.1 hypothetical protein EHQ72_17900 [Leptospira yasudae]TGL80583.1 hypothetical protein EHQ77_07645 [Leptospira yasudae]TGL84307.1 hypothetical protein EHQ83_11505 [Leptospira yasudae]